MSFVSYAQNFEDILLWRCFRKLKQGFYIDVGAAWPQIDSVTHAFYERGWSGINIEPNEHLYAKLLKERTRDINISFVVGAQDDGSLEMYLFEDKGLSTTVKDIAQNHIDRGEIAKKVTVEATTLKSICQKHVPPGQTIHFLKIDVEGLEREVLLGSDFSLYRPQVIIVESTLPMSSVPCWDEWQDLLIDANYKFVYFDGLNRFYVSNESAHLAKHFELPVNLWDDFTTSKMVTQTQELARLNQLCARYHSLNRQINDIYCSRSWRLTAPLRFISERFKRKDVKYDKE